MKSLNRIFEFYINSSIHVALAVYCLSWLTLLNFDIKYSQNVLLFAFFATITGYNFVKYFGVAKFHHRSLAKELRIIQIFSLLSFIGMCYFVLKLETNTLYAISILGAITFLYAIPFLPKKILFDEAMNLRKISGLKIYVIAFVWSCTTVIIPIIEIGIDVSWDVLITAIQRFIYVIVVMLPFEIRDMRYDSVKLSTVPQQIGVKKTKLIGLLLLIPFFFLELLKDDTSQVMLFGLFVTTLLVAISVIMSKIKQSEYFSSFWVESIPIVWLLITLVGTTYL